MNVMKKVHSPKHSSALSKPLPKSYIGAILDTTRTLSKTFMSDDETDAISCIDRQYEYNFV